MIYNDDIMHYYTYIRIYIINTTITYEKMQRISFLFIEVSTHINKCIYTLWSIHSP